VVDARIDDDLRETLEAERAAIAATEKKSR
jgi:hypothetical protein